MSVLLILPITSLFLILLILGATRTPVHCPRCGTQMPWRRKPAGLREALLGGWTCPECRCRMDRHGREIG